MTRRTFIAIDIWPGESMLKAASVVRNLYSSSRMRWARLDPAHITLAFLGETSPAQVETVSQLLQQRLGATGSVTIGVTGFGSFGRRGNPSVLWLGVNGSDRLTALHAAVNKIAMEAGFNIESRTFKPHITLGRVSKFSGEPGPGAMPEWIRNSMIQETEVAELVFYESILKPDGPEYVAIRRVSL